MAPTTAPVKFASASAPSKKKRHVAKHVAAAAEARAGMEAKDKLLKKANRELEGGGGEDSDGGNEGEGEGAKDKDKSKPKAKAAKKPRHVKPPSEASNYLIMWQAKVSEWKFNKNTQSWLLRHMYNDSQVNKKTFGVLLEYLKGLKGKTLLWCREEAKSSSLKYKEWEKTATDVEKAAADDDKDDKENEDEVKYDGGNFDKLSSKQKRKVYKRARRVYDGLKGLGGEEE